MVVGGVAAGQKARHLLGRAHRRRQADALRGGGQHGVETFQRQRQMRAAFGARDRVHLVDDDGLHRHQRFAGRRGEHQEKRFRGGDEDVGRLGDQLAAPIRVGCRRTARPR